MFLAQPYASSDRYENARNFVKQRESNDAEELRGLGVGHVDLLAVRDDELDVVSDGGESCGKSYAGHCKRRRY